MSSEISIVDIINRIKFASSYLLKRWIIIILVSFFGGILGIVYTWNQDAKYNAVMTFVTEGESGSGLGGYASIASQFGIDLGGGASSIFSEDNLVVLLKSRLLVDKTLLSSYVGNSLFIDQYLLNHKINSKWKDDTVLNKIDFSSILAKQGYDRKRDSIFNSIANYIITNQLEVDKIDKKLNIIYIKISDNDMFFAKAFVERLAENAIKFYTYYKTKKNQENVDILQKQTDSVKSLLFGNISEVASINDLNVNPIKQSLRTNGQKSQIDLQVNNAVYTELLKNLEIAKLTLRKETPLIQIIDKPNLPLKNEKKGRLLMGFLFAVSTAFLTIFYLLTEKWIKDNQ